MTIPASSFSASPFSVPVVSRKSPSPTAPTNQTFTPSTPTQGAGRPVWMFSSNLTLLNAAPKRKHAEEEMGEEADDEPMDGRYRDTGLTASRDKRVRVIARGLVGKHETVRGQGGDDMDVAMQVDGGEVEHKLAPAAGPSGDEGLDDEGLFFLPGNFSCAYTRGCTNGKGWAVA